MLFFAVALFLYYQAACAPCLILIPLTHLMFGFYAFGSLLSRAHMLLVFLFAIHVKFELDSKLGNSETYSCNASVC